MALSPQWLDELRARITLSSVIQRTTKLQKAGREWKACCPFHNENTPSFTVSDEKGFYHCFGCGAHGDVIRWMTDQRGMGFMDAVKELAAEAGMDVPAPDPVAAAESGKARRTDRRDRGGAGILRGAAWLRCGSQGTPLSRIARASAIRSFANSASAMRPTTNRRCRAHSATFDEGMLVESGMRIAVDDGEHIRPFPRPADAADPGCARAGDRIRRSHPRQAGRRRRNI